MVDLEYLKKSPWEKFVFGLKRFFKGIPSSIVGFFKGLFMKICGLGRKCAAAGREVYCAARDGDWKTRLSFAVMGFGQLARGQVLRGILYLLFEVVFILYLALFGWKYLVKLGTLGEVAMMEVENEITGVVEYVYYDNSLLILLYSIITLFFIIAFVYVWYYNVKGNKASQDIVETYGKLPTTKDDIRAYADSQYHKTLLAMPMIGVLVFTVFPIIFMIFIAFTNYDSLHTPPSQLFTWVGGKNFVTLFGIGGEYGSRFFVTFGDLLLWTLVWSFFATFSNYFLGMVVAIMINRKGIKLKKLWRTVLVMTIAVPQFISLLLMSQMLSENGMINSMLLEWGWISQAIPFFTNGTLAKITVIIVNIWIGIPFTMLIVTGILMNIPEDLYESARIDGAGPVKAYFKITLPYMLHVTTPYLISQFVGNLNNFNVIFLLTAGEPLTSEYQFAGKTDLLITWLYKLTYTNNEYGLASVISILMFVITAVISIIVYRRSSSIKNEEEFM